MTPEAFAEMVCRPTLVDRWVIGLPAAGIVANGRTVSLSVVYDRTAFYLEADGRKLNLSDAARDIFRAYMESLRC